MKTDAHTPQWMWPAGCADSLVKRRYLFSLLLGLSLLIHLLVLAGWPSLHDEQIELALPVADFAVQLQQADNRARPTLPAPLPESNTVINSKPVPTQSRPVKIVEHKQHIQPQTAIATQAEPPIVEENVKTSASQTSSSRHHSITKKPAAESNHNRVISRLQNKLKQYFYYPRLAQRKNIQGTVVIGFAIDLRGTLTNIRIIKSSGFAILDMAAEDALIKVHHLDSNQNWQADNHDLELPVIYKLTEG